MIEKLNFSVATARALEISEEDKLFATPCFGTAFFDALPNEVLFVNVEGKILSANETFLDFFKLEQSAVIGKKWHNFITSTKSETDEWLVKTIARKRFKQKVSYLDEDFSIEDFHITFHCLQEDPARIALFHKRLSKNEKSFSTISKALHTSEQCYQTFISHSNEGIFSVKFFDPPSIYLPIEEQIEKFYEDGRFVECNDSLSKMFGYERSEDVIGKRPKDFAVKTNPANKEFFRTFIKNNYKLEDVETVEKDRFGNDVYYLNNRIGIVENGKLIRVWGTQRDITALKKTEKAYLDAIERLRQSQKIEPIGRLAGGIAHDFNNFLAVIMLHIDMMNMKLEENDPLRMRVSEIKTVTDNAARMVKQLLAFSRKQTLQPRPVILNDVIDEFGKIIRSMIGEDIEIEIDLEKDLGVCFVDTSQIIQVLMNLAVNARDAMSNGGKIKIKTANIVIDENTFKHKAQPKGSYVQLSFKDTGSGMDNRTKKHIFEPFFTTKESHKGTGLGLATVYGIIKQSKGFIWVDSKVGEGTQFDIHFPRTDKKAKIVKKKKDEVLPRGDETILVVEDSVQIRTTTVEILKSLGYQILEAKDSEQAIRIAKIYDKKIHLLLTDVVMPKKNGREVAKTIKKIHPKINTLFISGYTDDIITRHGVLEEGVNFLGKPFSPQTLAVKVRESLEKKA